MKKLLVCDLDGTLLDQQNQIDAESLALLKKYARSDNDFCVCTGRLDEDIKFIEHKIGVQGAYRISQNGAVIRNQDGVLLSAATIPEELIPEINQIVFSRGLRVEVSDINHRYFPSPRDPEQVAEFIDTSIVTENLPAFTQEKGFKAIIYLIFGDTAIFKPIIAELKAVVGEQVNIQQTSPTSLEIFSKQASKGQAINGLIEEKGYDRKQVYVAGDAENDTTMFPLTLHSYAVGPLADTATINAAEHYVNTVGEILKEMEFDQ
ncbi:Cof-type HAD-IIB family hydrolase [Latilactobacillus fuchuensis]|uniref:Cof-type HAD-IIB family hydrolase n=1 Tax=Latilactobacillus fuchuensis TaxID=164393 RepID=UPI0039AF6EA3